MMEKAKKVFADMPVADKEDILANLLSRFQHSEQGEKDFTTLAILTMLITSDIDRTADFLKRIPLEIRKAALGNAPLENVADLLLAA